MKKYIKAITQARIFKKLLRVSSLGNKTCAASDSMAGAYQEPFFSPPPPPRLSLVFGGRRVKVNLWRPDRISRRAGQQLDNLRDESFKWSARSRGLGVRGQERVNRA
ncbi:hypothetical protein CEXT_655961 [Caerostris extrusa]|uniref:Uncharacterized protein n=1 Tax=Caerostris extrusa TaxID=172846 RepID=A0AAV4QRP5_CAEEX|nr:hypothetical protein CEXT_655961 [Caerostris extrusa]